MHLSELLDRPQDVVAWQIDERELAALVPKLSRRIRQLEALRVRLAQEAAFRGAVTLTGASSAVSWLAESSKLTPGHAKRVMSLGADLDRFPDVKASFENGDIDTEQAQSIIGLLLKVPAYTADIKNSANGGNFDDPAAECAGQCTKYLLTNGARESAEDTRRRVAGLASMLQPDETNPPDDENEKLNEFFASRTAGGRLRVKGHFDKATGEQLMTALSALSKPQPGRTTTSGEREPDARSAPQRRADAFADIIRHYLDTGTAPGEGGERPHMTVFVGLGDLAKAARGTGEEPDEKTPPTTRLGSSFIRRGPAWMPWLGPIGLRLAVTASCDASITPIVMDDDGNPLDVGRTTRTIPRRLRRALDARDCGCAFPGCGRPAAWTDGHHIHHWSNGGETKLSNLVLLCRFHHTLIHKGDWQVHIGHDQHPWFTPPNWIDHERKPIPAHNRSQLLLAC
ncbi:MULTISPECIES: HNH endonuclease signature motif containing protein [unclassified Rhodococcus (in: high G+C Gram-positive bacteria)]|uniref:HNH endonuclease signature motif containing protein n=1 Tax=unclassified Rhodococcus (in: high G+C Gram-positive bacteria) TaxID=192944 RepID=UPI000BD6D931|nr:MULTISPECIES: HNH endonuclease signature motif containing protein [unclassified Rhodococcus (in: high G+C Gram-positive bacteria)]MBP1158453.1 hypothetical protein [Rhodococcus sp. PvR099]PTR43879.1 HNH endonuclease [Rhodococcus sp. OK611]SNX90697.1 HNH endonuclease [Rhodococcus sp. OK270]